MPLISVPDPAAAPDGLDRLLQDRPEEKLSAALDATTVPPERPGFGTVLQSTIGGMWMQGVMNRLAAPAAPVDPGFNPYVYIANGPLRDDARIVALAERGQFDSSTSLPTFNRDLSAGLKLLDDADVLSRTSGARRLAAGLAVGIADPVNLIPGAAIVKGVGGVSTAAKLARMAGVGAMSGLASKGLADTFTPAGNDPGLADEAMTAATAGGFSAGLGFLLGSVGPNVAESVSTLKLRSMLKEADAAIRERPIEAIDYDSDLFKATTVVPAEVATLPPQGPEPVKFTRAEIERRIIDAHQSLAGSFDSVPTDEVDTLSGRFTFPDRLPAEVLELIKAHPETRAVFRVARAGERAGGEDYLTAVGLDKFTEAALNLGGADLRLAKRFFADNPSASPEAVFLSTLHDNLPRGGIGRSTDAVNPADLPVGTKFEIGGEMFEVTTAGPDGYQYKALVDGDVYPETPADALPAIPVDRGSVELPEGYTPPSRPSTFPEPVARPVGSLRGATKFGTSLEAEAEAGRRFLERVLGEDPVDDRVVVALRRDGDPSAALLGQLQAKYAEAGKRLNVMEHPAQPWFDSLSLAREVANDPNLAGEAAPEHLGYRSLASIPGRFLARVLGKATPGGRLADAPLAELQRVYRTLSGSAATLTKGSAVDPLTFQSGPAAENLKAVFDGWRDETIITLRKTWADAVRGGGGVMYDGSPVRNRGEFNRAVADLLRRRAAADAGFTPRSVAGEIHPSIEAGAKIVGGYFRKIGKEAHRARMLDVFDESKAFLPRVYDVPAVRAKEADFKARLVRMFEESSLIDADGMPIAPERRPLIPDLIEKLDPELVKRLTEAKSAAEAARGVLPGLSPVESVKPPKVDLVEGDLPDAAFRTYDAARDAYWRSNAETVFRRITSPEATHGVEQAVQPFKGRSLRVDESQLSDFLVSDLDEILGRYGFAVHGRVGVRRAIQLNPTLWEGVKLKDGTPIETGEHLIQRLHEVLDALDAVAREGNRKAGRTDASAGSLTAKIRTLRRRVDGDVAVPLAILEGRQPFGSDGGVFGAMRYLGRMAMRGTYLNKLGSVAVAQMSDLAPLVLRLMSSPREFAAVSRAVVHLKGFPTEDLRAMNLAMSGIVRDRQINGVDDLVAGRGFGEGRTRQVSAAVERGSERLGETFSRATLLPFITDLEHRVAGTMVLSRMTRGAQQMAGAARLIASGKSEADALRAVGLDRLEVARLNKLGLNATPTINGELSGSVVGYLYQTWKHGLTDSDVPIRDLISAEDFAAGKPVPDAGLIKPNFNEWDGSNEAVAALRDTLMANVNGEVTRSMIVGPGVFDRPLINSTLLGRMFNQFQSFALAFANQRLRVVGQLPLSYQASHLAAYVFLGAMSDAISNHLSGRRSLDSTLDLWEENPSAAMYGAVDRSGVLGWLGRPLAIADALKIPLAPSRLLGAVPETTAARHVESGRVLTMAGPVAADVDRLFRVAGLLSTSEGRDRQRAAYEAWKLAPGQNLLWFRLLHQATGAPVIPEAIRPVPAK